MNTRWRLPRVALGPPRSLLVYFFLSLKPPCCLPGLQDPALQENPGVRTGRAQHAFLPLNYLSASGNQSLKKKKKKKVRKSNSESHYIRMFLDQVTENPAQIAWAVWRSLTIFHVDTPPPCSRYPCGLHFASEETGLEMSTDPFRFTQLNLISKFEPGNWTVEPYS